MRDFGEWALACLAVVFITPGCVPVEERSADFALKETIPLGIISVKVNDWEDVPNVHPPLGSLSAPAGEKAVAVFVRWSGLKDYAEHARQNFARAFLERRLTLVDSEGFDYPAFHAMTRDLYRFSGSYSTASRDWVVIFHTWVDSQGYTLRIRYPDPGEEDFDVAIVQLK
jgi:hypothetical protein